MPRSNRALSTAAKMPPTTGSVPPYNSKNALDLPWAPSNSPIRRSRLTALPTQPNKMAIPTVFKGDRDVKESAICWFGTPLPLYYCQTRPWNYHTQHKKQEKEKKKTFHHRR